MSETKIEWTDRTWNPVRGCALVSPGCKRCYAMKQAHRFSGPGKAYEGLTELGPDGPRWTGKARPVPEMLEEPLHWKKPQRIFVNSMSDLFHEDVPLEFIAEVFGVMAVAARVFWSGARSMRVGTRFEAGKPPQPLKSFGVKHGPHVFQILTKRPGRMKSILSDHRFQLEVSRSAYRHAHDRTDAGYLMDQIMAGRLWPLPNVWLGVSVETQQYADERVPLLLQTPAAVRFISYEPALGPVDLMYPKTLWPNGPPRCCSGQDCGCRGLPVDPPLMMCGPGSSKLDWVIVGGESGPGARPFNIQWARDVVQQCRTAGVACFVKQFGAKPFLHVERSHREERPGFKLHIEQMEIDQTFRLKDRKGGDMSEWSNDLRVRNFPLSNK